jgi:DNA sulfur modification protein DndC
VLGFSGGKDSSALLKLLFLALRESRAPLVPVTIVYCDTGVDIPIVTSLVRRTLRSVVREARADNVPIRVAVARPPLKDRFFVKVIGRGYPTPTNKFRWCTDRLRIDPVRRLISRISRSPAVVLLGIRRGESNERDRTIWRHGTQDPYSLSQARSPHKIFAPLLSYSVQDIWSALRYSDLPSSIDVATLERLYRDAGAECPVIRDPNGPPCGVGRFGCWCCTVVRRDRAVTSMVAEGHTELAPLLRFRNWLSAMRDNPRHREKRRRNGSPGPGPLTLSARKLILRRLLEAQSQVPWKLISIDEIRLIRRLWQVDESG